MKTITVEVTAEDIACDDGESISTNCTIARAIRRALPLAESVVVPGEMVVLHHILSESAHDETLRLPILVAVFIGVRDGTPPALRPSLFSPFTFALEVPDKFVGIEPKRNYEAATDKVTA